MIIMSSSVDYFYVLLLCRTIFHASSGTYIRVPFWKCAFGTATYLHKCAGNLPRNALLPPPILQFGILLKTIFYYIILNLSCPYSIPLTSS